MNATYLKSGENTALIPVQARIVDIEHCRLPDNQTGVWLRLSNAYQDPIEAITLCERSREIAERNYAEVDDDSE